MVCLDLCPSGERHETLVWRAHRFLHAQNCWVVIIVSIVTTTAGVLTSAFCASRLESLSMMTLWILLLSAGDLLAPDEPRAPLVALLADMGVVEPGVVLTGVAAGPPQLPAVLWIDCTCVRLPAVCVVLAVPGVHRPAGRGPASIGLPKGASSCPMPSGAVEPKGSGVLLPLLVLTQPPSPAGGGGVGPARGSGTLCCTAMPGTAPPSWPVLWGAGPCVPAAAP